MSEIAAKLVDALSMFWQSLDDRERRLLAIGSLYLLATIVAVPVERRRREREQAELVELVAARLEADRRG